MGKNSASKKIDGLKEYCSDPQYPELALAMYIKKVMEDRGLQAGDCDDKGFWKVRKEKLIMGKAEGEDVPRQQAGREKDFEPNGSKHSPNLVCS
jgi:hypothetical protein